MSSLCLSRCLQSFLFPYLLSSDTSCICIPRLACAFMSRHFRFARLNFPRHIVFNMSERYNFRRSTRVQQLPPHRPRGSPQDPTPRIELRIEDLDLDKSYVDSWAPPKSRPKPRKSRPWAKWTGNDPFTDPAQLPPGWHMNEDDLETK